MTTAFGAGGSAAPVHVHVPKHALRKRRRGRTTGGIVAGAVLLLAGLVAVVVIALQNTTYSPITFVTTYTDDIAAGRFAHAWADAGGTTSAATALIDVSSVELDEAISEVTFGDMVSDGDTRSIPVSYQVDGRAGEGTVVVRSVGRELLFFDVWQIESGLETEARIAATGMTEVLVGGVAVPLGEDGATLVAYPGVYPVSGPESEWVSVAAEPLGVGASGGEANVMLARWEQTPRSLGELADELAMEPATLSPLLKRLEVQGRVARGRSDADERMLAITLTDAGRALRAEALTVPEKVMHSVGADAAGLLALRDALAPFAGRRP